jgi:hypothetical protein
MFVCFAQAPRHSLNEVDARNLKNPADAASSEICITIDGQNDRNQLQPHTGAIISVSDLLSTEAI